MKLKVPFKLGRIYFEKELDFVFKIASLEYATNDVLGCDLWGIEGQDPNAVNVAILYGGYVQACREQSDRMFYQKKQRLIYSLDYAKVWISYMSDDTKREFIKSCSELIGSMGKKPEGEKKK